MATEQLILLLRDENTDEKFKNSASFPIEAEMEPPIPTSSLLQVDIGDARSANPVIPNTTMLLIETEPYGDIRENASRNSDKLAPNKLSLSSITPAVKTT
jgi:hypothetical protein